MAAIRVELEVGPETRELIERLGGKLMVQIEIGPKTRKLIKDYMHAHDSEAKTTGTPPSARRA